MVLLKYLHRRDLITEHPAPFLPPTLLRPLSAAPKALGEQETSREGPSARLQLQAVGVAGARRAGADPSPISAWGRAPWARCVPLGCTGGQWGSPLDSSFSQDFLPPPKRCI